MDDKAQRNGKIWDAIKIGATAVIAAAVSAMLTSVVMIARLDERTIQGKEERMKLEQRINDLHKQIEGMKEGIAAKQFQCLEALEQCRRNK